MYFGRCQQTVLSVDEGHYDLAVHVEFKRVSTETPVLSVTIRLDPFLKDQHCVKLVCDPELL